MNKFSRLAIFALVLLSFVACRDDNNTTKVVDEMPIDPPRYEVTASVFGVVLDVAGNPIEDAKVNIENTIIDTDENGVFQMENAVMDQYGTLVTVEKSGYFRGLSMYEPRSGKTSNVVVTLVQKNMSGSFNTTSPSTVNVEDASIAFAGANFVDSNGNAYDGTVNVYGHLYDAADPNTMTTMPGDLRAISSDNELVQLATYGMVGVELESPSGESLQLAEGSSATITIPIANDQLADAPQEIPLWHMAETTGYWIEEGVAIKEGNEYVGQVSHFSFWNCDYPYPLVQLEGSIELSNGDPISGVYVEITIDGSSSTGYDNVDEDGYFGGKVPANEALTLNVKGNCGNVVHTQDIGPFSSDVVLPTITIDPGANSFATISGILLDCDLAPVTNGYVTFSDSWVHATPEADGSFTVTSIFCDPIIEVIGYDLDNLQQSTPESIDLTSQSVVDLGNVEVCETLDEYVAFTIDGENFVVVNPSAYYNAQGSTDNRMEIYAWGADSTSVQLSFETLGNDTSNPIYATMQGESLVSGNYFYVGCEGNCDDFTVTIGALGMSGDYVEGTFEGTLENWNAGSTVTVDGSFRVQRDE